MGNTFLKIIFVISWATFMIGLVLPICLNIWETDIHVTQTSVENYQVTNPTQITNITNEIIKEKVILGNGMNCTQITGASGGQIVCQIK